MASKIFDAETLIGGTTLVSTEMAAVGNLVIDVEFNGVAPSGKSMTFTLMAHEDELSSYKPLTHGESKDAVKFSRNASGSFRQGIYGVDSMFVKLYVDVPVGVTAGSITVWATQTSNPNS